MANQKLEDRAALRKQKLIVYIGRFQRTKKNHRAQKSAKQAQKSAKQAQNMAEKKRLYLQNES